MQYKHQLPNYVGSVRKNKIVDKINALSFCQCIALGRELIIDIDPETDKGEILTLGVMIGTLETQTAI